MALEIKRKEKENVQNLVHRFTKSIKQSGILLRARSKTFSVRNKSKNMQKASALRKIAVKKVYENLKKMGKMEKKPRSR